MDNQPQYEITDDDKERCKRIHNALKAYEGELRKPLIPMEGEADDNVLSNRVVQFVNAGNDFLFGKELQISVEEGAPQEAQDFLDDTWGRKETRIPLLLRLGLNGAVAGSAFLRIVPGRKLGKFRLIEIDPSIISVKTAPQDCQTVLLYCLQYCVDSKDDRNKPTKVYYREEISRIDPDYLDDTQEDAIASGTDQGVTWQIQHWTQKTDGNQQPKSTGWTPAGEPYIWPYPFAPIFSCQNLPKSNSFWGYPDIAPDLIELNNALNLVQSNINVTGKIQRILYATGAGEGTLDIAPGKIIQLPLTESKIVSVPLASDTANMLAFAANLRSDIDEQSAVPGVATGRIDILPRGITGIAIELLYGPLLKKTDKKRCTYGELIIDVSKALLVLNNMSDDIDISLSWESPLPVDDLNTVQACVMLKEIGVSNASIMRKLGYDPDEELALSQAEDAQKLQSFNQGMGMPPSDGLPPAVPGVAPLPGQPPAALPMQQPAPVGGYQ